MKKMNEFVLYFPETYVDKDVHQYMVKIKDSGYYEISVLAEFESGKRGPRSRAQTFQQNSVEKIIINETKTSK